MARMPGAIWKPLAADWASQPRMRAHDIFCLHTMVGGLDGTDGLFRVNNGPGYDGTESHFGVGGDGTKVQWQDILFQADANYLGNHHVISSENADTGPGFPKWTGSDVPAFTPAQIESNAQIMAWVCSPAAHVDCPPSWACHREGIPLELIPDARPGRRGIAYHRQGVPGYMVAGAEQWSLSRGKACPGDRRIAQLPQIIARATQLLSDSSTPDQSEDDDMPRFDVIRNKDDGAMVLAAPGVWFRIPDPNYLKMYAARGLIKSATADIDVPANEFNHFRDVYLSAVLDAPIQRSDEAGGGTTSLRSQAHWDDHNFRETTPRAVAELVATPHLDADTLANAFARPEVAEAFAAAQDRRARDGDPATGPVS